MISEIFELLGLLGSLPDKNDKPINTKLDLITGTSILSTIISIIFIIPEFKEILKLENSLIIIFINIIVSIFLSIIFAYILKQLNLLTDLTFSSFLTLVISINLIFILTIFYLVNYFY